MPLKKRFVYQIRMRQTKRRHHLSLVKACLLQGDALWFEECKGNIPKGWLTICFVHKLDEM